MTSSPLPKTFDPFATHPFTNNSGVLPDPPKPSLLPNGSPYPSTTYSRGSAPHPQSSAGQPMQGQQQQKHSGGGQGQKGVFTTFRQETASPDLHMVLKKK